MDKSVYKELAFQYPFRRYQNLILNQVESTKDKDHKFHIVSPPGSGKTIVGLELIRRFGEHAVVFTPTSTIQLQWRERMRMFIPPDKGIDVNDIVSTKPGDLKLVNVFTYQLLSTPCENLQFIEESSILEWKDRLVKDGIVQSLEDADRRIEALKKNNPEAYSRELSKHYKRLKDSYMRDMSFDGTKFLHPNPKSS